MHAAVLHKTGDDTLDVVDVEPVSFGPGRVRVKMHKAGLCHSDLSAMSGVLAHPAPFVPGMLGGRHLRRGDRDRGLRGDPDPRRRAVRHRRPHRLRCHHRNRSRPQHRQGEAGFVGRRDRPRRRRHQHPPGRQGRGRGADHRCGPDPQPPGVGTRVRRHRGHRPRGAAGDRQAAHRRLRLRLRLRGRRQGRHPARRLRRDPPRRHGLPRRRYCAPT